MGIVPLVQSFRRHFLQQRGKAFAESNSTIHSIREIGS